MDHPTIPDGYPGSLPRQNGPESPAAAQVSVLFVDDDTYMRRLMAARLEHLGARIEAVPSAQAALAYLESNRPDLIVTDAVMPSMDGFDLCRRIKQDPLLQSIPVVILTALVRDLRQRSIQAGADDFLSKLEHEVVFRMRARLAFELGRRLAGGADESPVEGGSVLVVSEAKAIQAQLETHLRQDGIQTEPAGTLDEALGRIQAAVSEVLVLDLALGVAALEPWLSRLRALPGCSTLPILALATKGEEAWLAPLEHLIQDRLPKPLDGQESRHRVSLLLRLARL